MKRHPSLEPFSRDHNVGLVLARRAIESTQTDAPASELIRRDLVRCWDDELKDHFREEERLLLPLIIESQLSARLLKDHSDIEGKIEGLRQSSWPSACLPELGRLLDEHIRWEERNLFSAIEASTTQEQMALLSVQTDNLETRRASSDWSPRRGELMAIRKDRTTQ